MATSHNNTTVTSSGPSFDPTCFILNDTDSVLLSHKVSVFASLFFVIIGIIGNMLSLIVFTHKTMRNVSSNTYLLMLAISDSLYLVSVFLTTILKKLRCLYFIHTHMDIINRHGILCKLFQFTVDFFSDYSTLLILVFTIERVVAVYLPIRFKELCTVFRARLACLVMFIVISAAILPYHFLLMDLYDDGNGTSVDYCAPVYGRENAFTIWYIAECSVFRILPVFAIAVLNVFIIIRVTRISREHRKRKAVANKRSRKDDKNVQLTMMLILVSTSYVLVYLPVLVHFVLEYLHRTHVIDIDQDNMFIAGNYTSVFYVSGFAINFFLYTVSGKVFLEQLLNILCPRRGTRRGHGNGAVKTEMEALTKDGD